MKVSETAQAVARVAVVNVKSLTALQKALEKWFAAQFVKGMKLALLRSIHQAGAYSAFAQLLSEASDTDRVTILAKLDKNRPEMQMKSNAEMMKHIEQLATGLIEPAGKPKPRKKESGKGKSSSKKKIGIISNSKY